MLGVIILMIAFTATISWLWAGGIDYMHRNHPDYKGEDFLDWGEEENKNHTEGDF